MPHATCWNLCGSPRHKDHDLPGNDCTPATEGVGRRRFVAGGSFLLPAGNAVPLKSAVAVVSRSSGKLNSDVTGRGALNSPGKARSRCWRGFAESRDRVARSPLVQQLPPRRHADSSGSRRQAGSGINRFCELPREPDTQAPIRCPRSPPERGVARYFAQFEIARSGSPSDVATARAGQGPDL